MTFDIYLALASLSFILLHVLFLDNNNRRHLVCRTTTSYSTFDIYGHIFNCILNRKYNIILVLVSANGISSLSGVILV